MNQRKSGDKGFLLFEAMLAVAVLSAGIAAVYGAFSRSLKAAQVSRDRFQAGLLLEGRVWELEHGEESPVEPYADEAPLPNMKWDVRKEEGEDKQRRIVALSWGEGDKRDEVTLPAVVPL